MAEDGFFSRWSRRKAQVARGEQPVEPAPPAAPQVPVPPVAAASTQPVAEAQTQAEAKPAEPPPTLEDVAQLGRESDYSRFVARDVAPDVKNAALRKLFSDPHFNVMDGLDIYIDDYNKPDPLPAGMLRQLAQSKMLGLFDDEEEDKGKAKGQGQSHNQNSQDTAPGTPAGPAETAAAFDAPAPSAAPAALPDGDPAALPPLTTNTATDEDPDLQLQPHHAAGRRGPGQGPAAG